MDLLTLDDIDVDGKTVLLRVDINAPIEAGRITDETRLRSHKRTIEDLAASKLVILAHQSRPGRKNFTTLEPHSHVLAEILDKDVNYVDDLFGSKALNAIERARPGEVLLLENVRFYAEELLKPKTMDALANTHMVRNLSELADYYVNDAFAAAHRAQTSLVGFTKCMPSVAGRVMETEITMLSKALNPEHPAMALLGGAKVKDSIAMLEHFLEKNISDKILTTGVVANIFLAAEGYDIKAANIEFLKREYGYDILFKIKTAKSLMDIYHGRILTPSDVALDDDGRKEVKAEAITNNPIRDVGRSTIDNYIRELSRAKSIVVNGPVGVYEHAEFALGTKELFKAVADSQAFSVVGGGETRAAMSVYGLKATHMSVGGGACLNFLAGKPLPAVEALKESKKLYDEGYYDKKLATKRS